MPRSGATTREGIMEATQDLVYRHGFSATTIDKVIAQAGVTKGAFFYHFKSKADLGRSLIQRYAESDLAHFERQMARAEKLSSDPRQQVVIFVGLLQEDLARLPDPPPGCLFASYIYERAEYPDDVADIAAQTMTAWRDRFAAKLREALAMTSPPSQVRPELLAETLLALIEGGYVLAKATRRAQIMTDLVESFRQSLERTLGIEVEGAGER